MNIPFVDLKAQYHAIKEELDTAIFSVIDQTAFISGQFAKEFETEFGAYAGAKHTISCANGTDSLEILLKAMNVGPGDEVIVPALTWISTAEAVSHVGATPVFADIDAYYTIDVADVERKITSRTKAIMPVHLYGQPADMPAIMALANQHNLLVLEDSAQAHGAQIEGKGITTYGHCGSFSFYPGKNLGAYGDAGCMVTDDDQLAETARMISNHGQQGKHNHRIEGRNSRMDGIQAAILRVKLRYIEAWTEQRIACADYYRNILPDWVDVPQVRPNARHVYHLFVIQHDDREGLARHLKEKGIATGVHYPTPLPLLECYQHLNIPADSIPNAVRACNRILSLPIFPEMTRAQQDYIAESLHAFQA